MINEINEFKYQYQNTTMCNIIYSYSFLVKLTIAIKKFEHFKFRKNTFEWLQRFKISNFIKFQKINLEWL